MSFIIYHLITIECKQKIRSSSRNILSQENEDKIEEIENRNDSQTKKEISKKMQISKTKNQIKIIKIKVQK